MDYYIIRIYQRDKGDPDALVGTVEAAGSSERQAFREPDELWSILSGSGRGMQRKTRINKRLHGRRDDENKNKKEC